MPINLTYYLKSRQIKEIYNGTNQSQAMNNLKLKGFFFFIKNSLLRLTELTRQKIPKIKNL